MLTFLVPQVLAQNIVVRIEERQFKAGAGRITFSEVPLGTVNPIFPPTLYQGDPDSPTVQFGGYFLGQRLASPEECPRGAAPTGCLGGAPRSPLTIDSSSPRTIVVRDNSVRPAYSILLIGSPQGSGPIAIWFDRDLAAVGLYGVGFDAVGGTAITVYDRNGRVLGSTVNRILHVEFMGLATSDLSPRIAGLAFHLVGAEPLGFGVDNIRFGTPQQINMPGVLPPAAPAPLTYQSPQHRPIILP